MILVAPPQTTSHLLPGEVGDPLLYVLICQDRVCFVLTLAESIRAQRPPSGVSFVPWWSVEPELRQLALDAIKDHHFTAHAA